MLTSESSSTSGAGAWGLSSEGLGLGGAEEGVGESEVREGASSPSSPSRAGKAARPTSSSGMSSRVLVSAARRASFSLSMI